MKATLFCVVIVLISSSLIASSSSKTKEDSSQSFTGEIMDTLCTEHHGHQYMMQQMKSMGTDKQTCIQKCLQLGAKLALYDAASGNVYSIANQDKAVPFEGHMVHVTGTLNKKKITISEIMPTDK